MDNCRVAIVDGQLSMDNCRVAFVDGQLSIVICQLSMVICQSSCVGWLSGPRFGNRQLTIDK